jgi:hypothetical protein
MPAHRLAILGPHFITAAQVHWSYKSGTLSVGQAVEVLQKRHTRCRTGSQVRSACLSLHLSRQSIDTLLACLST